MENIKLSYGEMAEVCGLIHERIGELEAKEKETEKDGQEFDKEWNMIEISKLQKIMRKLVVIDRVLTRGVLSAETKSSPPLSGSRKFRCGKRIVFKNDPRTRLTEYCAKTMAKHERFYDNLECWLDCYFLCLSNREKDEAFYVMSVDSREFRVYKDKPNGTEAAKDNRFFKVVPGEANSVIVFEVTDEAVS